MDGGGVGMTGWCRVPGMAKLHVLKGSALTLCGKPVKVVVEEALGMDRAVMCGSCRRAIKKGKV